MESLDREEAIIIVSRIARRMPRGLKSLRGKLMLEAFCEKLGVEEVSCPACGGTGWLDRRTLRYCPICCGFQEAPRRLADWFRTRLARERRRGAEIRRHEAEGSYQIAVTTKEDAGYRKQVARADVFF
ncbi:MAG: hypothetical protein J7M08_03110 [Planctomycetes bacterium]|nr:hypothetical protein [Planctomycetota bacterium]